MTVQINVKTQAKTNEVIKISENNYTVYCTSPPHENQANNSIIKLLSDYFNLPQSLITIKKGHKNKLKIVEIDH